MDKKTGIVAGRGKVMKKVSIIGAVALIIFLMPVIVYTLGWLGYGLSLSFDRPPAPEIKYGEFPFKLTYEINGETKVIEDTIVCEFDGYEKNGGGTRRVWKAHLKSGNSEIVLLQVDELAQLYCIHESADYYMDDMQNWSSRESYKEFRDSSFNWRFLVLGQPRDEGGMEGEFVTSDEALTKYGVKIISWEPSEPIDNTFKGE